MAETRPCSSTFSLENPSAESAENIPEGHNNFFANIGRLVSTSLMMAGTMSSSPDAEEEKLQATAPAASCSLRSVETTPVTYYSEKAGRQDWKGFFRKRTNGV